ncbi:unnamed protein product [Merluccius merluccius]
MGPEALGRGGDGEGWWRRDWWKRRVEKKEEEEEEEEEEPSVEGWTPAKKLMTLGSDFRQLSPQLSLSVRVEVISCMGTI